MFVTIYGCNGLTSDEITRIEVESETSMSFLDEFALSDYQLVIHRSSGETDRIGLEESMILTDDLAKLSEVGNHTIRVEYDSFQTEFSLRMLDKLLIEQMRLLHRIEGRTETFDQWYNQLQENHSTIDFNDAVIRIDIYGEVFIMGEEAVSLGHYFSEYESAFKAYVESSWLNDQNEMLIEIPGEVTLNFGEVIVYWQSDQSPYLEYQSRFNNYQSTEDEFVLDILFGHLVEENKYQVHFSTDTIVDLSELFDKSTNQHVVVAGVVTEILSNGFVISDGETSVLLNTFGQTAYRNIKPGMVLEVVGTYLVRDQAYYIRPSDFTIHREDFDLSVPIHEISIQELYDDYLLKQEAFSQRFRLQGGLFLEDGNYYLRDSMNPEYNDMSLQVELTWTTQETRQQLREMVGKWVEIEVILFDYSNLQFRAVFAGKENTLLDTEDTEYEMFYDRRFLEEMDWETYGYYDHPLDLLKEGPNGSTFTYTSLNPSLITDEGVILEPFTYFMVLELEVTIAHHGQEETFTLPIPVEPLRVREIASLRWFVDEDQGMVLVQGVIYHLEHHEDEGVYWVMIYDQSGYLRMRIDDEHDLNIGDNIRVSGIYEFEFDNRGEIIEVIYVNDAMIQYQIPAKDVITVNEFLTMNRYRDRPIESGIPVYLSGFVKQDGTAYYLYDELLQERVRIFSQNSVDWSLYVDEYVELMMFIDVTQPVRMLTTLQAREVITPLGEEFIDIRKDSVELKNMRFESYEDPIEFINEGEHGSTITWESTKPELINDEGVILQTVNRITEVPFKVTLEQGDASLTITISVYILVVSEINDLLNDSYQGVAVIEAIIYYIDEYGYVYMTDGTGNIMTIFFDDEDIAIEVGNSFRIRGNVYYAPGVASMIIEGMTDITPIDLDLPLVDFEGPYTVHTIKHLDLEPLSLVTIRGVLNVDNSVYLFDDITETRIIIYPSFYLEPYYEYEGKLIEIDVIIYPRGDHYEVRIDGGPYEGIRVLDDSDALVEYELLYFENFVLDSFRESVELPSVGPLGTPITDWQSLNPDIFDDQGNLVALPDGNKTVVFTGKLVYQDDVVPFEFEVELLVRGRSIESFGKFNGFKEVFIEGVVYSQTMMDGNYFYFLYDGTGFAVILTIEDNFVVGESIIVKGLAEYHDGWIFLTEHIQAPIIFESLEDSDYVIPDIYERDFETLFKEKQPIGAIVRVEATIDTLIHDMLYLKDVKEGQRIVVLIPEDYPMDEFTVNRRVQMELIIDEFFLQDIAYAFMYSEGEHIFLD